MIVTYNYPLVNKIRKHEVNIYIKIGEENGKIQAEQRRN